MKFESTVRFRSVVPGLVVGLLLLAAPAATGQGTAQIYTDNFGVPHIVSTGTNASDLTAAYAVGHRQMQDFPVLTLFNIYWSTARLAGALGPGDTNFMPSRVARRRALGQPSPGSRSPWQLAELSRS